jgi:hypothetical protein
VESEVLQRKKTFRGKRNDKRNSSTAAPTILSAQDVRGWMALEVAMSLKQEKEK